MACDAPPQKQKPASLGTPHKRVENINFLFPASGYAYDNQEKLAQECLAAMHSNKALISLASFNDSVTIQFLASRQEMKQHTGTTATGIALPHLKKVFIVAGGDPAEVKPPIKHELMHLVAMVTWGNPHPLSLWMNEGLAALAANTCNGFTPAQIYRYLRENNRLLQIDSLSMNFYRQPEMIAYHQAAFIVQRLLEDYGIEKFRLLWVNGFTAFHKIYGVPFRNVYTQIQNLSAKQKPVVPIIDWPKFEKGCL